MDYQNEALPYERRMLGGAWTRYSDLIQTGWEI